MCDGCGWEKIIAYIDEHGKGFCEDCYDSMPVIDKQAL